MTSEAQTPLGWISSDTISAYTLAPFDFEISATKLKVNDTIDFLNVREDLLAGQQKLVGKSGDLDGEQLELYLGLPWDLEIYYQRQQQAFTVDLGTINSVKLVDISPSLDTTLQNYGLKWTFWKGNLLNPDNRISAAALEVSGTNNQSDDFGVVVSEIYLPNLSIFFRDPQTFSVADLEDDGWKARLIYTWPFAGIDTVVATVWGGYGASDATSSTTSDLTSATIKALFEQQFTVEERYYYAGASLTWNPLPRLPITLNYEYIRIRDSAFTRNPDPPQTGLPGFLTQTPASLSGNHTLSARIAWWLTPQVNLSLTGNLYSNQFIGVVPHFSNPLSGSFGDKPYGFAGLQLGFNW